MSQDTDQRQFADRAGEGERLILQVDSDLFRAFQRCIWIIVHETASPESKL